MLQQGDQHPPGYLPVHPSAEALMALMRAAGIHPSYFCRAYREAFWPESASRARAINARFKGWLSAHAPDHPFLGLTLMTVPEAFEAAGIPLDTEYATEIFAPNDDQGHPEHHAKWVNWLKSANAVHACGWGDDHVGFADHICRAIDDRFSILVSERFG